MTSSQESVQREYIWKKHPMLVSKTICTYEYLLFSGNCYFTYNRGKERTEKSFVSAQDIVMYSSSENDFLGIFWMNYCLSSEVSLGRTWGNIMWLERIEVWVLTFHIVLSNYWDDMHYRWNIKLSWIIIMSLLSTRFFLHWVISY